ncbi:MAG: MMPL family transporter [Actinomycetota bacterium]|nr:MMPL family transporter [Actinomycetota bacterium]
MERWTRFVIRRRWLVVALWTVVFLVSSLAMQRLSELLTNRFSIPGSDTARAERILEDEFGQRSDGSFQLVFRADSRSAARAALPGLESAARRAAGTVETGRFVSAEPVSERTLMALVTTKLEPAEAKNYTDEVREAAGRIAGGTLYVTGAAAITHDLDPVFAEDIRVGEFFIAIPIALAILVFVFGTLAFLLPLVFAAAAIPATLAIVWIFANFMELSSYLENMVMLIGLGIAIDYSLLVVYRYREERRSGISKEEAIVRTMATAGRAVVFSGTAVAIGLALMLAMPLPFMRGFGIGGLVIPLVSVVCALTLLPVLLYVVGDKLDRVRVVPKLVLRRRADEERNMWMRLARWIMRRPLPFAIGTSAVLLVVALPVLTLEVGPGTNKGIPQDLPSVRGLNVLAEAVGEGAVSPTEVAIDTRRPGRARSPEVLAAVRRFAELAGRDPEVTSVVGAAARPPYVDRSGRYLHLQLVGEHEYGADEAMDFARRLRSEIVPAADFPAGVAVYAGGGPPSSVDVIETAYGAFPWLVLGVLVLTYFLLLRAFRSLLLPLKAIVLNLLSISAAYGLLVLVFKLGAGGWLGLQSFDQIEFWIPIFLFAMLFGLSMDYEVFLVSRMREEWDRTADNERSVALGLAKTGRIVTAAGLIMFAAFMGFVVGSILGLQQFGLGLAAAIILDVTIIRALLVPSAMKLFGRWNWWLPPNVARVFRVQPSPLEREAAPALTASGR